MDCEYCHSEARKSLHAGVPPTQTCMGCHAYVRTDMPEIAKLTELWKSGDPTPWQKVHDLPDYVYFTHKRHVKAGVQCTECHGQVQLQGMPGRPNPGPGEDIASTVDQVMVREALFQTAPGSVGATKGGFAERLRAAGTTMVRLAPGRGAGLGLEMATRKSCVCPLRASCTTVVLRNDSSVAGGAMVGETNSNVNRGWIGSSCGVATPSGSGRHGCWRRSAIRARPAITGGGASSRYR